MFRSCRNRFRCFSQMKITKPELFRLALKIILVGTRIVLSPHAYFQFDQTLKNVVVNSESTFWIFLEKCLLGYFPKRFLEGLGAKKPPLGGPHEGGTFKGASPPWSSTCHPFMRFMTVMCDIKCGHFGFFMCPLTPWVFL